MGPQPHPLWGRADRNEFYLLWASLNKI
jgi:hypothetical protein